MADIFGPATADNAVTVRPTETRTFDLYDTWFKDCSDSDTEDGTEFEASFFNGLIAALRSIARANGATAADSSVKIVPEIGTDDNLLIKAIQHLVQRGLTNYAEDSGAASSVVVTLQPALVEYRAGLVLWVKAAEAPTGATTINVNGLGTKAIVNPDGSAIAAGQWSAGAMLFLFYNGLAFELKSSHNSVGPTVLTAARTFYVNAATGSDSYDGATPSTAFATIKKAASVIGGFNLNGYTVSVYVADGTYNGGVDLPSPAGTGKVVWTGNRTTPGNCVVNANDGRNAFAIYGGSHELYGFKVQVSGSGPVGGGCGVSVFYGDSRVILGDISWGATLGAHLLASRGSAVQIVDTHNIVGSPSGAGAAASFCYAYYGAVIDVNSSGAGAYLPTLNLNAAANFTGGFCRAEWAGLIFLRFASQNGAGPITGPRYYAQLNGIISSGGGGVNYYPGNSAGSTLTGGQYV